MKKVLYSLILGSMLMMSCQSGPRVALISTDYGDMKVELFDKTPNHRDNFVKLVEQGFYDDLLFHRVINGFMIQGGDPNSKGADPNAVLGGGGPGYTLPHEIGSPHLKGALAAARMPDATNPDKASSGSQFYIVQGYAVDQAELTMVEQQKGIKYNDTQKQIYTRDGGTPGLDMDYTVYGQVIEGMEVIDKIASVATNQSNRPVKDVKMKIKMIK